MKKLSSLSAKVGDLNMHAEAVRTRTATTGTHTHDTVDHDPPTPPMTNNSTAVGEPTPFPPSNHDHIPTVQRLELYSDSATGPQSMYADQASCSLSAPYTAPRPGKVLSTALAAHASHAPILQSSCAQAPVGAERPHCVLISVIARNASHFTAIRASSAFVTIERLSTKTRWRRADRRLR